jgi:DNA invertase Pin-like site-specific DNA recombinase
MKIGYAKVRTRDQSADLQIDALTEACCERIYADTTSGAKAYGSGLTSIRGDSN